METPRLVVVDGYSLLYRAFFATRFLSTSDGRPTNALFGFVSMLFGVLEKETPVAVVVALDAPGKTFRHAEYVDYKGTRKETQDELKVQLDAARELIAALGIPSIEVTGYEADDVIGTISRLAEGAGYDTTVVTGDLDALQLVDDHVRVLTLRQGVTDTFTYDREAVIERLGVGPEAVPDFKAIKGDTSDNIPGVPGIGDKGAAALLQQFGSIEAILERFDEVEPKYRKKIEGNIDVMKLSKWLATIVREVPLEYDFAPFILTKEEFDAAQAFLESYEFKSLARRAVKVLGPYREGSDESAEPVHASVEAERIEFTPASAETFDDLRKAVGDAKEFAAIVSAPIASSLFQAQEAPAYVAVGTTVWEAPAAAVRQLVLARPEAAVVHDAKPIYRSAGIDAPGEATLFDSLTAAFVLKSDRTQYAMRDLIQSYLDVQAPNQPEEAAVGLLRLRTVMTDRLEKEGQWDVFNSIERPLTPILARMETYGIAADRSGLREFSQLLEVQIAEVQAKVYELAGREFLIGSPKQLGQVLFDELQLPGSQKTKTGYATGVEILGELAGQYEIAAAVLKWRELTKLKSTYADSLERLVQPDGRIHTTYNQVGAATGRLSSIDPNLQNIPIRSELGRPIRRAFHAADGYRLASLDYSQIELRVLAHMCGEPALTAAFRNHEDVHSAAAAQIFGLGDQPPTKDQRRTAKMLNYAVLYGVTEFGLAQQLGAGFSAAEAKELIRQYNERFPSVHDFTQSIVQEARATSFTTTLRGRRRYFHDIHASRIIDRRYAERQAMNAPIQGTAADMLKLAMIDVDRLLIGKKSRMLLTVHDELVFEMSPDEQEELFPQVAHLMTNALPLDVPVEVDGKVGQTWDDMTPVSLTD